MGAELEVWLRCLIASELVYIVVVVVVVVVRISCGDIMQQELRILHVGVASGLFVSVHFLFYLVLRTLSAPPCSNSSDRPPIA
jgi:hypothetical protein